MVGRDGIEPPTPGFSGLGRDGTIGHYRTLYGSISGCCRYFGSVRSDRGRWYPMVLTQFYSFDQPNHPHLYDSTRHACNYPLIATPSKTECENANPSGCRYALAFSLVVASIRA